MTLILDVDDVLLDWAGGFRDWANALHGLQITGVPQSWDLSEWTGVNNNMALIEGFNESPAFGDLAPVEGVNLERGHPLICVTSCSSKAKVVEMRRRNLIKHFGDIFDEIHCLDLGHSKRRMLSDIFDRYGPCHWIEDNYKNACDGRDSGHHAYMLRRPHNIMHEKPGDAIVWFSSWNHFEVDMHGEIA